MTLYKSLFSVASAATLMFSSAVFSEPVKESDIRAYYSALTGNQIDAIRQYFHDDIRYEDVATGDQVSGEKAAVQYVSDFVKENPGIRIEPVTVLTGENHATVEWNMSAGTGADAWSVRGATVIKLKDGEFIQVSDYWNN